MAATQRWIAVAAYLFIGIAASFPAGATVVGGGVTSGAGSFVKLWVPFSESSPDNTVGSDNFESLDLFAFDESQNIAITDTVLVNVGTSPTAGQTVASHYVFVFDPGPLRSQICGFRRLRRGHLWEHITNSSLLAATSIFRSRSLSGSEHRTSTISDHLHRCAAWKAATS